jgi:hypothetical protein
MAMGSAADVEGTDDVYIENLAEKIGCRFARGNVSGDASGIDYAIKPAVRADDLRDC